MASGNLAKARERYEAGLIIAERLAAHEPGNTRWQRDLFVSYAKLAQLGVSEEDEALAVRRFEAAEAIMRMLVERHPDHPGFSRDLAQVRAELARVRGES